MTDASPDPLDGLRASPDPRDPRAPSLLLPWRGESLSGRPVVLGFPYDGGIPSRPGARRIVARAARRCRRRCWRRSSTCCWRYAANDRPLARSTIAAHVVQLMQKGYGKVRPLAGGIEAWLDAGYSIEVGTETLSDPAT